MHSDSATCDSLIHSRPQVMAILNTTPDSFLDGGQLFSASRLDLDKVLQRVEQMVAEGADMIDVGGESTRPGATPISVAEELERVVPVVEAIRARFEVPVSVDTSSADVIRAAAQAGAALINDVRALTRDGALAAAADSGLPVCLMHMQGEPGSMQNNPDYGDVVADVGSYLASRVEACVDAGINKEKLILDPGFGFGKTLAHNLALFRALPQIAAQGLPLLVGVSRKTMIGAMLAENGVARDVNERLIGSVAMALMAAQKGAAIIRVHDVKETVDALTTWQAVEG